MANGGFLQCNKAFDNWRSQHQKCNTVMNFDGRPRPFQNIKEWESHAGSCAVDLHWLSGWNYPPSCVSLSFWSNLCPFLCPLLAPCYDALWPFLVSTCLLLCPMPPMVPCVPILTTANHFPPLLPSKFCYNPPPFHKRHIWLLTSQQILGHKSTTV